METTFSYQISMGNESDSDRERFGDFWTTEVRKAIHTMRFYHVSTRLERPRSLAHSRVHPRTAYTQVRASE